MNATKSVRIGTRQPYRQLQFTARVIAGFTLIGLALIGYRGFQRIDVYRHLPVWWLLREMSSGQPFGHAELELRRRWVEQELSESQVGDLAQAVISLKAAPAQQKEPLISAPMWWCVLVEHAHQKGRLTEEQWAAYWKRAIPVMITVPRTIAEGQPLMISVGCGMFDSDRTIGVSYRVKRLTIGKFECDPVDLGGSVQNIPNWSFRGGGTGDREIPLVRVSPDQAPGGEFKIHCLFDVTVTEDPGRTNRSIITTTATAEATVTLPPGLQPVHAVQIEGLRDAIRRSLAISNMRGWHEDGDSSNVHVLSLELEATAPPVDLSFDVELCRPDQERSSPPAGTLTCVAGASSKVRIEQKAVNFDLSHAKIILRRSLALGAKAGMTEVWGEDVVFDNVAVQR